MTIGEAIVKDIKEMFNSSELGNVLDNIGTIYSDSIEEMNRQAREPDGASRTPLNQTYADIKQELGRQDVADFYFSGDAYESFYYEESVGDRSVGFGYDDATITEYMLNHEQGTGGVPERRQFPIESDLNSAEQQMNYDDVEQELSAYLNTPRVIRVSQQLQTA
jgi:hypothetical protein